VGQKLAELAKAAGITKVVFDRNYYRFHGRVKAFAEAAAKGGMDFLLNPKKKDKPPKIRKEKSKPAEKVKKEKKAPPEGAPHGAKPQGPKPEGKKSEGKKE
jgi:hypothetical protein